MDKLWENLLRPQLCRENLRIVGGRGSSGRRKPESLVQKPMGDIPSMARGAVADLEGEIATIQRTDLLRNGAKIDCVLSLGQNDITGQDEERLRQFVGDQFFKLSSGSWQGEGGVYGPNTLLGQALERSLQRQLSEEKKPH